MQELTWGAARLLYTVIVLELIVTFADTFPNQSKMSGQIQNQGVQSLCTGTNYRKLPRSIFAGL